MKKIVSSNIFFKIIIIILSITLILIIFQFINANKKYNLKGEDVNLAFYNGDQQLSEMPVKGNADNLGFDHAECNNGAIIERNRENWAPITKNITKNQTKCNLYFAPNLAINYFYDMASKDTTNLAYDDTEDKNLRYIGNSPNNYIDIGDRNSSGGKILWRVIGVMNNLTILEDEEIHYGSLVKIIRADSIGDWSWDSSSYINGVNRGSGVNEWSQADIMTTLNTGAYWNRESGQCYNGSSDKQATCDFSSTGLTESVKDKLAKVRWNTGTLAENYNGGWLAKILYKAERSNNHGKICSSSGGSNCNDKVERRTTWDGYVGLMYPSDYGYAVGGDKRISCLTISSTAQNCTENNWLYSGVQWTITPAPNSSYASHVFCISAYNNGVSSITADNPHIIRPTTYLKGNTKIKLNSAENYGSKTNPFVIEGVS